MTPSIATAAFSARRDGVATPADQVPPLVGRDAVGVAVDARGATLEPGPDDGGTDGRAVATGALADAGDGAGVEPPHPTTVRRAIATNARAAIAGTYPDPASEVQFLPGRVRCRPR
jgi:hypothetical protein